MKNYNVEENLSLLNFSMKKRF